MRGGGIGTKTNHLYEIFKGSENNVGGTGMWLHLFLGNQRFY
jgi:hypothetical protein